MDIRFDIGFRLREFRIRFNIKMPAIAAATGLAKETLYKWEKGTRPSNLEDYVKLKTYLDEKENILTEELLLLEYNGPATVRLPFNYNRSGISQADGKAASGTIVFNDGPELIVDRINAPYLGKIDGAVGVIGKSMEPTFSDGSSVAITRLIDHRQLVWGNFYYIITSNWFGMIRRVYQGEQENTIKLVAENPDQAKFPPILLQWDQVETILKIAARIIKE